MPDRPIDDGNTSESLCANEDFFNGSTFDDPGCVSEQIGAIAGKDVEIWALQNNMGS